jgi:hypothetical protein
MIVGFTPCKQISATQRQGALRLSIDAMDDFLSAFTTLTEFDLHHEGLNFWQKKLSSDAL